MATPSASVASSTPARSSGRCSLARASAISRGTPQATSRQMGTFSRKIQRQPNAAAIAPPSVGPSAIATPEITPMNPKARERAAGSQ